MKYDPLKTAASSGIVLPLQSLRTAASPAAGEFPDLVLFGTLASSWGFDLIQLLPVNDSGFQSSPYSALSAFALHPLYLSIEALPELAGAKGAGLRGLAAETARGFSKDGRLRYGAYLEAKLALLERIWKEAAEAATAATKAAASFAAWIEANPWVKAYAVFVELKRRNGGRPWWQWEGLRDPKPAEIEALWEKGELVSGCRFRAWIQWRAEGQFRDARAKLDAAGIAVMGDLPILINEDSAEVWARRSVFRMGLAAGAPPDMYAELGQNWGFPIYDWEAAAADGYSFWKARLASAEKFYAAYRIDHVLGFFRIWALSAQDNTGFLGRFVPDAYITRQELEALGFDSGRLRWLSRPHVPTARLLDATGDDATAVKEAEDLVLDRIGNEELFLFKPSIRGEKDIEALAARGEPGYGDKGLSAAVKDCLLAAWRDRALHEFQPGLFVPSWRYYETTAWRSLQDGERRSLEELFAAKRSEGEGQWERTGRLLLGELAASSAMLPCAEDLGSVPACVPRVLADLGILGLRVLRWTREWEKGGQPQVELADYPRLTIACPSVHDSTSTREWYETEADRGQVWALAARALGRDLGPAPERLEPEAAALLLSAVSASASAIVVFPIQDLLALGTAFRPASAAEERINVPGTTNDWNWGWRLPAELEHILADKALAQAARGVARRPRARGQERT
jgi:4-alpha-glucanotransferase